MWSAKQMTYLSAPFFSFLRHSTLAPTVIHTFATLAFPFGRLPFSVCSICAVSRAPHRRNHVKRQWGTRWREGGRKRAHRWNCTNTSSCPHDTDKNDIGSTIQVAARPADDHLSDKRHPLRNADRESEGREMVYCFPSSNDAPTVRRHIVGVIVDGGNRRSVGTVKPLRQIDSAEVGGRKDALP